jgi:hypothetical protein
MIFNANSVGNQSYEVTKQFQDLKIDVSLFSETCLKPYTRFYIQNYDIYRIGLGDGQKVGTAVAGVDKGSNRN